MASIANRAGLRRHETGGRARAGASATSGNASATVSFTAPADNGSPIACYTVSATSPNCVGQTTGSTNPNHRHRLTDLSCSLPVTATNSVGTGPASAQSGVVLLVPASVLATGQRSYTDSGTIASLVAKGRAVAITIHVVRILGCLRDDVQAADPSEHLDSTVVIPQHPTDRPADRKWPPGW